MSIAMNNERDRISNYLKVAIFLFFHFFRLRCGKAHADNSSVNWKKVNVLVYTKNGKGYVHDNIPSAVACIQTVRETERFRGGMLQIILPTSMMRIFKNIMR